MSRPRRGVAALEEFSQVYSQDRRVVVTGLGAITPIGNTPEEFWQGLLKGKSGIDYIRTFDTSDLPVKIAGEVKDLDLDKYVEPKAARRMARFARFSVALVA